MNHTAFANYRRSFNRGVGIDERVAADLRVGTDVGVRRIDKGHAVVDHQPANGVASQEVFKLRELGARVDTGDFASIVVNEDFNFAPTCEHDLGNVGQVILALLVFWFEAAQRRKQIGSFKAETQQGEYYLTDVA